MAETANPAALLCTHCGASAGNEPIVMGGNAFCCEGCKTVYNILNANGLCDYYQLNPHAGVSRNNASDTVWNLEELNLMVQAFLLFDSADRRILLFHIPTMHCSSCIWLLERLGELDKGILDSRTDFVKKQLKIAYDPAKTDFGSIVILLRSLGYEPSLMPEEDNTRNKKYDRKVLIKLGVAGFCAGNIMMFSFPQYLGLDPMQESQFGRMFDAINASLSLPMIFYCAADYFKAFAQWLRYKTLSVKVPLAIGIGALWLRSIYEVASATGPGYFDSLAGLIFFLLIGTWLQNRTFDALRFGEKARKFFPLVARTLQKGKQVPKKVTDLVPGDRVVLGHGEIIPADGILMGSDAHVSYAFATGESTPLHKVAGEVLLGGGKNCGGRFEMEVIRAFDNGRLTEIWKSTEENEIKGARVLSFEARISKYFIIGTLSIAAAALMFWLPQNSHKAWFALTAVLMVACPCALALAPPFAYNIVANFMASKGFYLRKPEVVGVIGETDAIVFDKTGTLTEENSLTAIIPDSYKEEEKIALHSLAAQSNHPYSEAIQAALMDVPVRRIDNFSEYAGKGTLAECGNSILKLGSSQWVLQTDNEDNAEGKQVWFSVNNKVLEPIFIRNQYKKELGNTLQDLHQAGLQMVVSSGDTQAEEATLKAMAGGAFSALHFNQSPAQKVVTVKQLQKNHTVMMVGDGLNDAGALKSGDVGVVIAAGTNNFTPEADAILLRKDFMHLPSHFALAKKANRVVKETFVVSLTYNAIALGFAFTGNMSPLLAAILMPASSIALMLYAWGRTKLIVNRKDQA